MLRIVVWNTKDVILDEVSIVTGEAMSDIYVKGSVCVCDTACVCVCVCVTLRVCVCVCVFVHVLVKNSIQSVFVRVRNLSKLSVNLLVNY